MLALIWEFELTEAYIPLQGGKTARTSDAPHVEGEKQRLQVKTHTRFQLVLFVNPSRTALP